jgi:hypothetical protein
MRPKTLISIKPPTPTRLDPAHPLTRSLAACWLLNEGAGRSAHDVSGHRHDGVFSGGPVWSSGRLGCAVEFDGYDDWINMGDCLNLGTDDVTMLAIVKYGATAQPDEWSGLHVGAVAGKGHLDSTNRGYGLSVNSNNQIYWQIRRQDSNFFAVSDNALNDGQYHVAIGVCDRDSTMGVRLYVDGIQQATTADPTSINGDDLSGARAFAIGSRQESGGTWFWDFAGTVATVYVWKRVLAEAEVRLLQRDPFALFAPRPTIALLASPVSTTVDCSGCVVAQTVASASMRVTEDISGSAHGIAFTSAVAQVLQGISGTTVVSTVLTAVLTRTSLVQVASTAHGVTALHGALSRLTSQKPLDAMPGIRLSWIREALFNGTTGTAFKLGTALTQGWFWMRRGGCTALYGGATQGQVDFNRILQVADAGRETLSLFAHRSLPTDSTHCYLVRRLNSCGEQEQTTAAAVVVCVAPDGQLLPSAPNALSCLKGERIDNHKLRLTWVYCPLSQSTPPEQFNVYWDGGTGQIDIENPIAVIPYRGRNFYHYDSDALGDGQYVFVIKAVSADITESPLPTRVACQVRSLSCEPVSILAAQCI